ncbi:bestrophin-3-like isoform X2 [Oratosquilla oratoria]
MSLYVILSLIYRLALSECQRKVFEKISLHCHDLTPLVPLTLLLSFYVNLVVKRWWDQFKCIPWIDSLALYVSTAIHGQGKQNRMIRRTIMRYTNLAIAMTFSSVSPRIKKQFSTLNDLIDAGLLHSSEATIIKTITEKSGEKGYWIPLVWAGSMVSRARKEGRISDDFRMQTLLVEINSLRSKCGDLLNYDWICIPLVYTQVVTIAVYTFFLSSLFGRQFLDPKRGYKEHKIDFYVPVFSVLQFLFYMGWLKVAESLVNPYGDDDDDFEMAWIMERNLKLSYLIVDDLHNEFPELLQDKYWGQSFPEIISLQESKEVLHRKETLDTLPTIVVENEEKKVSPEENEVEFENTAL